MKEKQYFCDKLDKALCNKWFFISLILLCIISCLLTHNVLKQKYEAEVAQYSENDYKYLQELVINELYNYEEKSFTFSKLPDNVQISDFTVKQTETTFTCILNKDYTYISNPRIFVTSSDMYNDIQITPLSKENATSQFIFKISAICIGLLIILIPSVGVLIILLIFYAFSIVNKVNKYRKQRRKYNSN